jgi:hypothetical protein
MPRAADVSSGLMAKVTIILLNVFLPLEVYVNGK